MKLSRITSLSLLIITSLAVYTAQANECCKEKTAETKCCSSKQSTTEVAKATECCATKAVEVAKAENCKDKKNAQMENCAKEQKCCCKKDKTETAKVETPMPGCCASAVSDVAEADNGGSPMCQKPCCGQSKSADACPATAESKSEDA